MNVFKLFRVLLRIVAVAAWAFWFWINQVGCGVWAGACLPANPLSWPLQDALSLLIMPAILVGIIFYGTRNVFK